MADQGEHTCSHEDLIHSVSQEYEDESLTFRTSTSSRHEEHVAVNKVPVRIAKTASSGTSSTATTPIREKSERTSINAYKPSNSVKARPANSDTYSSNVFTANPDLASWRACSSSPTSTCVHHSSWTSETFSL